MRIRVVLGTALVFLSACGGPVIGTEGEARARALEVAGGTPGEATRGTLDSRAIWVVAVTQANGAIATVSLFEDSGELYEVADLVGPFDYEMAPLGTGLLDFSAARAAALTRVPGRVVAWKTVLRDMKYFYEVYVIDDGDQLWEIQLWSDAGTIFSLLPKQFID